MQYLEKKYESKTDSMIFKVVLLIIRGLQNQKADRLLGEKEVDLGKNDCLKI